MCQYRVQYVFGGPDVVKALDVKAIWDLGLSGRGSRVAVIDTGINPDEIDGAPPVWEKDFTGGENPRDQSSKHGSRVAACIRLIAPDCELFNAKIHQEGQHLKKAKVAEVVATLAGIGVDVINISLDLDADQCDPKFRPTVSDWHGAILVSEELDRSTACELCLACWDAARQGTAIVAAAGNRWGKRMQCPARSPGVLSVEATWTSPEEKYYFWSSRSWIRRLWEWRIWGNVGRRFGTSFAAGYTSGEIALLLPFVSEHEWLDARNRILGESSGEEPRQTLTAVEMLRRLVFHFAGPNEEDTQQLAHQEEADPESQRSVILAIAQGHLHKTLAGQLSALEALRLIDPLSVSTACRLEVILHLSWIKQQLDTDAANLMESYGLSQLLQQWSATVE